MIHTLTLTFDLSIRPNQIYDFRGAFIFLAAGSGISDEDVSWIANEKYEKGNWGQSLSQYPRVQYRIKEGHAQIWAINEGRKAIEKLIRRKALEHFTIQDVTYPLQVIETEKETFTLQSSDDLQTYLLFHYVPHEDGHDKEYHTQDTMVDKVRLLERLITNGILKSLISLGIDYPADQKAEVTIIDIIAKDKAVYKTKDKNTRKPVIKHPLSYFIKFRSNLILPHGFSIGHHKSLGYGAMYRIEKS
ncbi:MAG: hypothetical protein IPM42_19840 [Saprospiraceae bacterium]|nr:hypothetical protein [Saprospiraceae bacterium]